MRLGLGSGLRGQRGFAPTDIAGCAIWLRADADRLTLVSSTHVSAWENHSAGAATLAQATDENRPTYVASDVNGHPGVRGGATKWLDFANAPTPTAMTLFTAFTRSSLANTYHWANSNSLMGVIENFDGTKLEWFNGADRYTLTTSVGAGAHIATVTQVNSGALKGYFDGALAFSHTAAVTLKALAVLHNAPTHANGSNGDILELIL